MGLRIGSGGSKSKAARRSEPVHRLEAAVAEEPLRARPMSEAGPAEPETPRIGSERRRGLAHWTGWMAGASCMVVVAAVGGLLLHGKSKEENRASEPGYEFEGRPPLDQEQEFFLENFGELAAEAEVILETFAAAATVDEVLPLARDAGRVKERMTRFWRPWGSGPHFAAGGEIHSALVDGIGRPAIRLAGRKGDFSRFELVFVREGGHLKLDWEASAGIGEVQIADLEKGAPTDDGVVRAVVSPANYYTTDFPEDRFRSYLLADAGGEHSIWAYAAEGSPEATLLNGEFNEGSVLLEASGEIRATVRLAGSGGKCHEITEILHKGWVTP